MEQIMELLRSQSRGSVAVGAVCGQGQVWGIIRREIAISLRDCDLGVLGPQTLRLYRLCGKLLLLRDRAV